MKWTMKVDPAALPIHWKTKSTKTVLHEFKMEIIEKKINHIVIRLRGKWRNDIFYVGMEVQ